MKPYVTPIYEVRSFDSELALTVRYPDDDPASIEIVSPDGGRVCFAAGELSALIDALRRIRRDQRRDEAEMERGHV